MKENRSVELKLEILDNMSKLTEEEYYYQCLEVDDEYNHYSYPVPIIRFSNKNWDYRK